MQLLCLVSPRGVHRHRSRPSRPPAPRRSRGGRSRPARRSQCGAPSTELDLSPSPEGLRPYVRSVCSACRAAFGLVPGVVRRRRRPGCGRRAQACERRSPCSCSAGSSSHERARTTSPDATGDLPPHYELAWALLGPRRRRSSDSAGGCGRQFRCRSSVSGPLSATSRRQRVGASSSTTVTSTRGCPARSRAHPREVLGLVVGRDDLRTGRALRRSAAVSAPHRVAGAVRPRRRRPAVDPAVARCAPAAVSPRRR